MNTIIKIILTVAIVCLMTGCEKFGLTSCRTKVSDTPYTAPLNTISWTDFNPLLKVDEYFLYHDSTLREHDGDTIKFYGYISDVNKPTVGDLGFHLCAVPATYRDMNGCGVAGYGETFINCREPVDAWMTKEYRKVYVKGIIICLPKRIYVNGDTILHDIFKIDAIQYDSVRF